MSIWKDENLIKVLQGGGVAVMPTDTIYGLVAQAENEQAVNRIYQIKRRTPEKPCIILISDIGDMSRFGVLLSSEKKEVIKKYWREEEVPTSIIVECHGEKWEYLHRGTGTLAFVYPTMTICLKY